MPNKRTQWPEEILPLTPAAFHLPLALVDAWLARGARQFRPDAASIPVTT